MLAMRQIFKERSPLRSRLYSSFLLGKKSKGELVWVQPSESEACANFRDGLRG